MTAPQLKGSCHCGAQRFTAPAPDSVTDCTCTTCTKRGTLAAYYAPGVVDLELTPGTLTAYEWGDRMMTFTTARPVAALSIPRPRPGRPTPARPAPSAWS